MTDWEQIFMEPHNMRLYIVHTGNVHMKGDIHINKKSPAFKTRTVDTRYNPVYCFLIHHPTRGYILVDTGIHPDFCRHPTGNFGKLVGSLIKVKTEPRQDVISQIRSIGVSPQDITSIIMTHLHPDHTSSLPLFRNQTRCTVYVDTEEFKAATSLLGIFQGYLKEHFQTTSIKHYVYNSVLPPFSFVSDIFGDKSVFIIKTPGHTRGHASVLLNLKDGPVLLTADTAHRQMNLAELIPTVGDYMPSLDSVKQLSHFINDHPSTRVIYSHDPDQIKDIKLFPQYYE